MNEIKALCLTCGLVEVELEDITLRLQQPRRTSYYTLDCPGCGRGLWGRMPTRVARRLQALGIPAAEGPFSPEVLEHSEVAPPLQEKDVEEFVELLERPDFVAALERFLEVGEY